MKKQLLNESEIRKMMKFANIGALTDGFVSRLDEAAETTPLEEDETLEEEEELEEGLVDDVSKAAEKAGKVVDKAKKKRDKKEKQKNEGMYADRDEDAMEEGLLDEQEEDDMDMDVPEEDDLGMDMEDDAPGGEMELSEEEADVLIALGERLAGARGGDMGDDMGMDDMGMDDTGDMPEEEEEMMEEDLVNEVSRRVSARLLAMRK